MENLFSKHKWLKIIYGLLMIAAGIIIILVTLTKTDEDSSKWFSIVVSCALFIFSLILIFSGIFQLDKKKFDVSFIYAAAFIGVGVTLLCKTDLIGDILIVLIGASLIAFSAINFGQASAYIYFKRKKFLIAITFISGAIVLTLGILTLLFKEEASKVIYVILGSLICLGGAIDIVAGIVAARKTIKNKKNNNKNTVIDAEIVENDVDEKPNLIEDKSDNDSSNENENVNNAEEINKN